ncbi:MAG: cation diffusion facilitator family transporter [Promethearchaeota archaeon]
MEEKLKFGIIALSVIIFQSIIKLYGVILTGSLSFLSETIDTLTDIVFVSMTLYSLRQSEKPPDAEHMYGHSKLDPIGAMVQGIVLINLYVFLIYNAIKITLSGEYVIANPEAGLQILVISFLINIIFSRILIWQAKKRKSLSLEIQGFNLFQDSLRAILVIISFIFALFKIYFLDIILSILLSIWIIIGAFNLAKKGVNELIDVNPVNIAILEQLKQDIFNLDHVIGVEDVRVRTVGKLLYLEVNLSVEDHISLIHAHHITQSIRTKSSHYFPLFEVENIIQMRPISSEDTLGDIIINLIYSLKADYREILKVSDINILTFQDKNFLSQTIIVDKNLSLEEAHRICTNFEKELEEQAPKISRIISHIEAESIKDNQRKKDIVLKEISHKEMQIIQKRIETVLKNNKLVKGYHGLECWNTLSSYILEIHAFFEGSLNISKIHDIISELEEEIKNQILINGPLEVIIHSEPFEGRKNNGIIFR